MHFKKLEIQGFKSFVDFTTLELEPGITAVIGPNGCGKSNVVDAIRWVLGEQSAKALRGSRMEDVIFNGTDNRKAVGMAEVSLTIDNSDKLLPTEHAEVVITRRTYRSGDSEYLINKAPCRLRDIQELFMDTGIGRSAYSILEQGKIDLIVSSKPSDRRFVFEEAAGISKYKSRKDESMRKLEATEQNYLRVNDIVVEVKRQINSLERQVAKARRYQSAKQELTTLEVALGRREFHDKKKELRQLEAAWQEHSQIAEAQEIRRQQLAQSASQLETHLQECEREIAKVLSEKNRLEHELIKADHFLSSSDIRKKDLQAERQRLEEEVARLHEKEAEFKERHASTQAGQAKKQEELDALRVALDTAQSKLGTLEQELKERGAGVQEQQSALLKIVNQISTVRGQLKNLETRQTDQETQLEKIRTRYEHLHDQSRESFQKQQDVEQALEWIKNQLEQLVDRKNALQEKRALAETELREVSASLEQLLKNQTQMASRIAWIEELKRALEGFEAGAKSLLQAHHDQPGRFPDLLGPLANYLKTDARFETAIESFLGEKLQYLVFRNETGLEPAMAFLTQDKRGRATLIPLESASQTQPWKPDDAAEWLSWPQVHGWAVRRLKVEPGFEPIFNVLFANVVLVEDEPTALKLHTQAPQCVVLTLDGRIITPENWRTVGTQENQDGGLLGRERELGELTLALRECESMLGLTSEKEKILKDQLAHQEAELKEMSRVQHELEIKRAQNEKSLESILLNHQQLNQQTNMALEERQRLEETLKNLVQQQQQLGVELTILEEKDLTTQTHLEDLQQQMELLRHEHDLQAAQKNQMNLSAVALEEQLAGMRQETDRVHLALVELYTQREQKTHLIKENTGKVEEIDRQLAVTVLQLEERRKEKEKLELETGRWVEKKAALGSEKRSLAAELDELQRQLQSVRQTLHQYELERQQQKMTLENLEKYLEEEYKLNLNVLQEQPETVESSAEPVNPQESKKRIQELKEKIDALGSVNLVAVEEYDELQERFTFLSKQQEDLKASAENLKRLIAKINQESRVRFQETFAQVRVQFKDVFRRLFHGGDADLILVDEENLLETGIDIIARPPGKKLQNISLLSGGEKAMTAIALLFAIFLIKPSPFCIFDEMDAPLDDANTQRFCSIVRDFAKNSQFIVITHNKLTMEIAGILYGVTMQESGISKLVSVKFKDEELAAFTPETSSRESVPASVN